MKKTAIISAIIYTAASLTVSGIFIIISLIGNYASSEIIGGSIWVFILSMIILMPVIIPFIKRIMDKHGKH